MADGKNDARALRILEIAGDFSTVQQHIAQLVNQHNPPDAASAALTGYRLLAVCRAEAQRLLAMRFDPGALGVQPGQVAQTEVQKAALQRIVLDISARRFRAHRCYLRCAAAVRWVMHRNQTLQGQAAGPQRAARLQTVEQRLQQEVREVTDQSVVSNLRQRDQEKGYWLDEDPTLARLLAWIQAQG